MKKGSFLSAALATITFYLVQPVIFSLLKGTNGRGVSRAAKRYMDRNF